MSKLAWFFNAVFNGISSHFCVCVCVLRTGRRLSRASPLPRADPLVFPFPRIFSVKTRFRRQCECLSWVSMVFLCKHQSQNVSVDEGVFHFYYPSSPSPPSLPSSFPSRSPCSSLTFTNPLVVPVHSIRLEYGCVVVDTCTVWSVSQCCRVMICCSWWCHRKHGAAIGSVETKEERGDPGSLKEKNKTLVPISRPKPIPEEPSQELSRSAQCHFWDLSLDMKTHRLYCMYFLWWYLVTLLTSVEKGGRAGRFVVRPWPRAYTFCLRWVISTRSEAVHSPKPTFSCWPGLKISASQVPESRKELILLRAECSLKEICPRYQRPRWICSTFKSTEPTVCQTTVLEKKKKKKKKKTRCQNTQFCSQAIGSVWLTDSQCLQIHQASRAWFVLRK